MTGLSENSSKILLDYIKGTNIVILRLSKKGVTPSRTCSVSGRAHVKLNFSFWRYINVSSTSKFLEYAYHPLMKSNYFQKQWWTQWGRWFSQLTCSILSQISAEVKLNAMDSIKVSALDLQEIGLASAWPLLHLPPPSRGLFLSVRIIFHSCCKNLDTLPFLYHCCIIHGSTKCVASQSSSRSKTSRRLGLLTMASESTRWNGMFFRWIFTSDLKFLVEGQRGQVDDDCFPDSSCKESHPYIQCPKNPNLFP